MRLSLPLFSGLTSDYNTVISSSHVQLWELNDKEGRALKNWCFWTVVLEKPLESPLTSKEINPVNPKGNQPRKLIGSSDAEAPILWPPDMNSWFIRKDPDAGKDWRQREKMVTEDEMVEWHQWTWTWANSRRWSGTGRPGVLQFMGVAKSQT